MNQAVAAVAREGAVADGQSAALAILDAAGVLVARVVGDKRVGIDRQRAVVVDGATTAGEGGRVARESAVADLRRPRGTVVEGAAERRGVAGEDAVDDRQS